MGKETESLIQFLDDISEDFEIIVTQLDFLIYKDLRVVTREAWTDLRKREIINDVKKLLRSSDNNEELILKLRDIGLWGSQLEWKIIGYLYFRERFLIGDGRIWRNCKQMLKWVDVILGSLTVAFMVLEPVKEFKEGLEASLSK
jgi:hypothetical protein